MLRWRSPNAATEESLTAIAAVETPCGASGAALASMAAVEVPNAATNESLTAIVAVIAIIYN